MTHTRFVDEVARATNHSDQELVELKDMEFQKEHVFIT